jgi:hypothetical protein
VIHFRIADDSLGIREKSSECHILRFKVEKQNILRMNTEIQDKVAQDIAEMHRKGAE